MSNVVESVFWLASSTTNVTVVVPTGNASPVLCDDVKDPPSQLSSMVGMAKFTTAVHMPESAVSVVSAGKLATLGARLSKAVTFTVMVAESAFMQASHTVKTTGLGPTSSQSKEVTSKAMVTSPQSSEEPLSTSAVVMEANPLASKYTVTSCARAVGEVVSVTMNIAVETTVFPQPSVAVKVTSKSPDSAHASLSAGRPALMGTNRRFRAG